MKWLHIIIRFSCRNFSNVSLFPQLFKKKDMLETILRSKIKPLFRNCVWGIGNSRDSDYNIRTKGNSA